MSARGQEPTEVIIDELALAHDAAHLSKLATDLEFYRNNPGVADELIRAVGVEALVIAHRLMEFGVEPPSMWHAPQPGPGYWDFRCMVCDQPVADHPSWWRRVRARWFLRRSER